MRNYTISGGFGLTCRAITTTNLAVVNFRRVRGGRDSGEGPVGSEHEQSRFLRAIFFPRRFRHLFHIGVGCVYTYPRPFPYRLPYPRFFYDRFARFLCFFSRFLVVGFFFLHSQNDPIPIRVHVQCKSVSLFLRPHPSVLSPYERARTQYQHELKSYKIKTCTRS